MKKFFKKLMVVALAVTLFNVGVDAEEAEAGTCSPHPGTYNTIMSEKNVGYYHRVPIDLYVIDEYGVMYNLSEITGETYYITCTVTLKDVVYIMRCVNCHYTISSGSYRTDEMHSYCPVG